MDRSWAQPVIRECAQFPNGEYDDWFDTVTQAIIWLRKTYHLEFRDEDDG
jgi:phage terminase large subunit-like protein